MNNQLTTPQRNVYITERFFGSTAISHVGGYLLLPQKEEPTTVQKAISRVIAANDGLRVRVVEAGQEVCQTIMPPDEAAERVICTVVETEDELRAYVTEQMRRPFETGGKLYDLRVIELPRGTAVMIKLHHYIADSHTVSGLIDRLLSCLQDPNVELSSPSYVDFIRNDAAYAVSPKYARDRDYWSRKYEAEPTYVSLCLSDTDPYDVRAGRSSHVLSREMTQTIRQYCAKHDISLAVFFEAVVSLYAMRLRNADDITLCTISANRNGAKERNTLGMFNTILPMTARADWGESFLSFCATIADEHYSLLRHSHYPLSDIMDTVRERHGKDKALYDIMVSYQADLIKTGGAHTVEWIFNGYCELGFMMNIDDRTGNGEYHINIDYQLKKFDAHDIELIWARLVHVMEQILCDENIRFGDVEIVTERERERILSEFNDTRVDYPRDELLFQPLERYAHDTPDKLALRFNGESLTYGELNAKVNALAWHIHRTVGCTDRVIGIALERSFEMLVAIYAVLKAGCAYMPIDPHFPIERIDFMVEDSQTPLIVTTRAFSQCFSKVKTICMDDLTLSEYDTSNLDVRLSPESTAYVIYTSGSTGKPKGAMIAHHSVVNRVQWMHHKYPLTEHDVILQKTPYTFDVSVWELFWWSMYGGTLAILIPEGHKEPAEIIQSVFAEQVTHMHFVPSMLNAFLEYIESFPHSVQKLSSLKYVFASGEALQATQVARFYRLLSSNHTRLINLYGPTECTVDVSYYDCDPQSIPQDVPIGKPIDNTQLLILDKYQQLLPVGAVGELYISGVGVGKGYLNRAELTKEKFVPDPFGQYPIMYRSGDLARWLPDGNIEYCGRSDFQIKIRGLRVELGDIENALLLMPGMKQVLITAPEINGEQHLCAYFTAEQPLEPQSLTAALAEKLPDYMIPQFFIQLPTMPVNNNGKIDRKQLPMPVMQKATSEYIEPTNAVEAKIREAAQRILNVEKINCTDSLLDCGMTSLGIISMVTYLSAEGYACKVRDIYEHNTICGLASVIMASQDQKADHAEDDRAWVDIRDIAAHQLPVKTGSAFLITGATGFLGIHIVRELYDRLDKTLYCLVRSEQKLAEYMRDFADISYPNDRIIPIIGDITEDHLGIAPDIVEIMKRDVSDIIHCAADVSFFCSWERAKTVNYEGTCHVIDLAAELAAKLHHMSTMSVSGDLLVRQTHNSPVFSEDTLFIRQQYTDNVYAHSKYLAETAVIRAIREDRINANIYRIGNITWRTSDGRFQKNYADNDLYILTEVMRSVKYYPADMGSEDMAIAPIDDVARAICSQLSITHNHVYHMYSDRHLSLGEYMRALDVPDRLPLDEFVGMLRKREEPHAKFALMYISGIISDVNNMVVHFRQNTTPAMLSERGFTWSRLGEDYVRKYFDIC